MRQTLAQRQALHSAKMQAERERRDVRDQKLSVKRMFQTATSKEAKDMWRTVWNRLVIRQLVEGRR